MSQPPDKYERIFDFTDFSATQPSAQQPGQKIDQELNAARESLNETIDRLGEIQRDDGKLRSSALDTTEFNGIVNAATATATAAASSATASATTATTKASEATSAATTASGAATTATGAAASAQAQATIASTSATTATTKAAEAADSAASALTSKNSAFASASSATSSAGSAAGSAAEAATFAGNAANSANQAGAQANLAVAAAVEAENSANSFGLSVGTVTTGASGSPATVSVSGSAPAYVLNFGIPTGPAGSTGATGPVGTAATIGVGTVTTGAAGSSVSITNVGTSSAAVFNFSIPRGDTGATGPQGPAGAGATWGSIGGTLSSQSDLNSALDLKLNLAGGTLTGKLNTLGVSTTTAGLNLPHGTAPTTPVNGDVWTTTSALQVRINGATRTPALRDVANTFSAGARQTFTSSSTTPGASFTPIATDPSTPSNGDIWVNSTTNDVKVRLNSVTETLAEQSWVTALASSTTPVVNGTAAVGVSTNYARADHVHPTDTSRAAATHTHAQSDITNLVSDLAAKAALNSPTFTGTPSLPTGTTAVTQTAGNNTTAVATTAFVQAAIPAASSTVAGKVELATFVESTRFSTQSLATTPLSLLGLIAANGGPIRPRSSAFTSASSGAGASAVSYYGATICYGPSASTVGYGGAYFDAGGFWASANAYTTPDWSKVTGFSVMVYRPSIGFDTGNTIRITLGKAASGGTLTTRGIGIDIAAGNTFAQILAHNGTTLTTTNSTFPVSSYANLSTRNITMVSYGNGTVELFVDGVSYGTSTGGPTTAGGTGTRYSEEVYGSGTQPGSMQLWTFNASIFTGL